VILHTKLDATNRENDPEYIKKVTIIRTGMLLRFLANILGETVVKQKVGGYFGTVLGKLRDNWGSAWSVKNRGQGTSHILGFKSRCYSCDRHAFLATGAFPAMNR